MKKLVNNFKEYYSNNKERCLTILTIIILSILSSIILISYSFYQNKSTKLIISGVALIDSSDVSIKVYRENKNDSGVGLGTYALSYYVPSSSSYSYVSSKTVCDTGITIEKYESQKFYVDATKKGKCKVYFDAIDGYIDDYEVNLFVQQEEGNTDDKNYNQMGQLPSYETGYYYTINTNKTSCTNGATVSIVGRNIVVLTTQKAVCNVYADKNIDNEAPTISAINVSSENITTTLNDNIKLLSYGISTSSSTEPKEWITIPTTPYTLNTQIDNEGTYYVWVKDTASNLKLSNSFTISLGTSITTLLSTSTPDVYDENGLRYEGADPNNYICLDSNKEGACSNSSLLFRIIGLFDEEYSLDGTNSSGTKKLLKVLDTNIFGGTEGKYWNQTQTSGKNYNDWSIATLKTELNETYLTTLLATSGVNSKLNNAIVLSKWHLGGANDNSSSIYYDQKITLNNFYKAERAPYATSGSLQNKNSSNPDYTYAKIGLMYPSDYGFATIGGSTSNKNTCATVPLCSWSSFTYSTQYKDCGSNDWIFVSLNKLIGTSGGEWMISPDSVTSYGAAKIGWSGSVSAMNGTAGSVASGKYIVRPTFYLDAIAIKIVGGSGTSADPYHIG